MKPRTRKPSYREVTIALDAARRLNDSLMTQLGAAQASARKWESTATARVDQTMMAERARLASSLGQMVEAVSRAIHVVVGKETM